MCRLLCLEQFVNTLKKAHSKDKGVLTLVHLPKIDEFFSRLQGSTIYSSLDMRSGYYHMELTTKSWEKSAFISPFKYKFKRCPFALAQAPMYYQRLINKVLAPFASAFGYLGGILIYSPDIPINLKHLKMIFKDWGKHTWSSKWISVTFWRNIFST